MSFSEDEEILEDFLVEAGEILEQLSDQLVQLERSPDDRDLLHAIFRGFHTVKGGAGFLQIEPLVELCHITENLFDILRNGQLSMTSGMMDVVLQALDTTNIMFGEIKARQEPQPADPELLARLAELVHGDSKEASGPAGEKEPAGDADAASESDATNDGDGDDEISEDEFEAMLDKLQGDPPAAAAESQDKTGEQGGDGESGGDDEISENEFEALLDELHGPGSHEGVPRNAASPAKDSVEDSAEGSAKDSAEGSASETRQPPSADAGQPDANDKPAKAPAREVPPQVAETTVRVDTRRLDEIMNMVGELVLARNRLVRIGMNSSDETLSKAVGNLDLVTGDLQTSVMKTRMQPIRKVFGRFPRVIRDLARSMEKEINLEMQGEDTDLDKNLVEALSDPLVHLVRNAVDHGIEQPDERERNGKPRAGTILLTAEQEGDHILLSIQDDGGGMDPEKLRDRAVNKGVLDRDAAARLSDRECFDLIFAPGFSTKQEVSDVSGRGVGMDVVKTKINQLNGSVLIDSELGQGSRIDIKVPLTLAIMPTLMFMVEEQTFALPLASVVEIFNVDLGRTNIVDGQEVVTVRDKALPLFYLDRWLVRGSEGSGQESEANVVIVSVGSRRIGFVVDRLIGQEEVVIKPLGRMLHGTPGMAGATITGDGRIALILDVPGLVKQYAH